MDGKNILALSEGRMQQFVLPDRLEQGKALVKDGTAYVEYATAKENLNDHLYKSDEEQQVILTTAVDIIKLPYDSNEYTTLTGNGSMPYSDRCFAGWKCLYCTGLSGTVYSTSVFGGAGTASYYYKQSVGNENLFGCDKRRKQYVWMQISKVRF